MIRGFIFDLDGTLVHSLPGIALALNRALADAHLPPYTEKEVTTFIGDGMAVLVQRALGKENAHLQETVIQGFQNHYQTAWKEGTEIYPGILDLLEDLHHAGHPLAVLSNKPHPFTTEIVTSLFPAHLFHPIQGHDEQRHPKKPDPASALAIVDQWSLRPNEVAYVGDSTVDLAAAQNARLHPIIFSWGYGTPKDHPLCHKTQDFHHQVAALSEPKPTP